jgi:hypothetical protein
MKKIFTILIAVVLVFSFTGIALAAYTSGSWTSSSCMVGFTATDPLTKPSTSYGWDHFYPQPSYVRYAIDNYVSDEGWLRAYVKSPSGTRMSGDCTAWKNEDDNVAIYTSADAYNTLRVRIENLTYPNQYNMKSGGNFLADYFKKV